jgi:8-hydroxy-5-deazaflavin:NADPH oxidoreductase
VAPLVALLGGTGRLGPGLALRFSLAGVPVLIGSREPEKGVAAAAKVEAQVAASGGGAAVTGHGNLEAAQRCDVAVVTIPHDGQAGLLPGLASTLAGKVVVSTAVAVRMDTELGPVWDDEVPLGSATAEAAALLSQSRIAAAFHSLSSWVLARPDRRIDSHVIVTGDDDDAKRVTMELAELLPGVRAVDGGPLRYARHSEHLTVLLLAINRVHRRHTGIVITDLPER